MLSKEVVWKTPKQMKLEEGKKTEAQAFPPSQVGCNTVSGNLAVFYLT
jgi:hypothetical protein